MNKPLLSKQAFWDVDMDKIDYEKNAAHVIEKVVDREKVKLIMHQIKITKKMGTFEKE